MESIEGLKGTWVDFYLKAAQCLRLTMFPYVDATPAGIFNPDDDFWHHIYKRDAEEGEEKKEGVLEKIKESPKIVQKEIMKDAKILSEKTKIPTW